MEKIVLCNCDDPYESNFFKYFVLKFNQLGLKQLICTCYKNSPIANKELSLFKYEPPEYRTTRKPHRIIIDNVIDANGDGAVDLTDIEYLLEHNHGALQLLDSDGDFRCPECIEFLEQADVVCTNPPFSLFREFLQLLIKKKKKFLIVGSFNAITYKEIFPLIKNNELWLGYSSCPIFLHNGEDPKNFGNVIWFTNLEHKKRHEELFLYHHYTPEAYPKYDNYDAINVDKVSDIPCDYDGVMGVPITFLGSYNPNQFEIIGLIAGNIRGLAGIESSTGKDGPYMNGKLKYGRILIRRKK